MIAYLRICFVTFRLITSKLLLVDYTWLNRMYSHVEKQVVGKRWETERGILLRRNSACVTTECMGSDAVGVRVDTYSKEN